MNKYTGMSTLIQKAVDAVSFAYLYHWTAKLAVSLVFLGALVHSSGR